MPPTTFELLCSVLIAMIIGVVVTFKGYRFFLLILPIFVFIFGFGLGAQTMHALFGYEMFATATSWVVGFITGLVFAVLSYFFWILAVGIFSFGVGYSATVGFLSMLGLDLGFLVWLIAVVVGGALVFAVLKFNIQKYVIIIGTSLAGAALIIASFLYAFGVLQTPQLWMLSAKVAVANSWFWLLSFLVLAGFGIYTQIVTTRNFVLDVKEVSTTAS